MLVQMNDEQGRGDEESLAEPGDDEEEEMETLKMADVKFSSCTNLPSALQCCQLDYQAGEQFGQNIAI